MNEAVSGARKRKGDGCPHQHVLQIEYRNERLGREIRRRTELPPRGDAQHDDDQRRSPHADGAEIVKPAPEAHAEDVDRGDERECRQRKPHEEHRIAAQMQPVRAADVE
jgi:hypothetical protein